MYNALYLGIETTVSKELKKYNYDIQLNKNIGNKGGYTCPYCDSIVTVDYSLNRVSNGKNTLPTRTVLLVMKPRFKKRRLQSIITIKRENQANIKQ